MILGANRPMARHSSSPGSPTFRRSFMISAAVFVVLVLATLAVVAHLIFKDLSQQVITRNLLNSLSEVKKQMSEEDSTKGEGPLEKSPELSQGVPLTPAETPPEAQPPQVRRFVMRGIREFFTIRDKDGKVVGRGVRTRVIGQLEPIHDDNVRSSGPVEEE